MAHNADQSRLDKAGLRKSILARRAGLAPDEVRLASHGATTLVESLDQWRLAQEALVYFTFRGEVDAAALTSGLWKRGARVLAPRCRPGEAGVLDVACITCLDELAPGAFGILEPHPESCPALEEFSPDVALIPAVAFDRHGGRLGFGQGFYDRLLAGPQFKNTFLIGLAHGFQVVDSLPLDPWDRAVHAVVTGEEIIWP